MHAPFGINKNLLAPLMEKFGLDGEPKGLPWYRDFAARAREKGVDPKAKRVHLLKQIAAIMREDADRTWFREAVEFFTMPRSEDPLDGLVKVEKTAPEPTEPIPVAKRPEPPAPPADPPAPPAGPAPAVQPVVATASSDEGADLSAGALRRPGSGPTVNLKPVLERLERQAKAARDVQEKLKNDSDARATAAPDPDARASLPVDEEFEGEDDDDEDDGF